MILVNGVIGIGTGWSTKVPKYNPKKIIANIKRLIEEKPPLKMIPWYRNFKGLIREVKETTENVNLQEAIKTTKKTQCTIFKCYGIYKILDNNTIHITELPISIRSFTDYIEYLKKLTDYEWEEGCEILQGKYLLDFYSRCGNNTVNITLNFIPGMLQKLMSEKSLERILMLRCTINTANMYLFNDNKIKKYNTTREILTEYCKKRLEFYAIRKEYYMKILQKDMDIIESKIRFIDNYLNDTIKLKVGKKAVSNSELIKVLEKHKFMKLSNDNTVKQPSYSYLTEMKINILTEEKISALKKERDEKKAILELYKNKTEKQLWLDELSEFEVAYNKWESELIFND